jgi:uncharacterized phiE125 gp8 family phage protein
MRLTLLTGPASEPLDLDDLKAHLRLDSDDEDQYLSSLITTSRLHVEAAMGLALITQRWLWQADQWPADGCIELPVRPVQTVEQVSVIRADTTEEVVATNTYQVDIAGGVGRLAPAASTWPLPGARMGGARITFRAGFADAAIDVPDAIRHALKLLAAHWYEVRDPVHIGSHTARVPDIVSDLLLPYKVYRL